MGKLVFTTQEILEFGFWTEAKSIILKVVSYPIRELANNVNLLFNNNNLMFRNKYFQ